MLTGRTYGGKEWVPEFILSIDHEKCIGCGACGRACTKKCHAYAPLEG